MLYERIGIRLVTVAIALLICIPAQAQFERLMRRVPRSANALVFIDAEKIMASGAAERGEWKTKLTAAYKAGLTILPAEARQQYWQPNWIST